MAISGSRVSRVLASLLLASTVARAEQRIAPSEMGVAIQGEWEGQQDIAYNSAHGEFLVVWRDDNFSTSRIMGRRLRHDGRPIGDAFAVAPSTGNDRASPRVAYDSVQDRYLVVYAYDYAGDQTDWDLHEIFLSWDGTALTSEQILANSQLSESPAGITFSWLGSKFLVVWTRLPPWPEPADLEGAIVGTPSSEAFTIASGLGRAAGTALAWEPWSDDFLVVWEHAGDILAKLVSTDGAIGSEITISAASEDEAFPAVASCENFQFLVVWDSTAQPGSFDREVYGRFLLGSGSLWGDPIHFAGSSDMEWWPDVACVAGGTEYLVIYTQSAESGTPGWLDERTVAQRVRSTGGIETAFEPIAPPVGRADRWPSLAGSHVGWLVTVMRSDDFGTTGDRDLYARVAWQLFSDSFEWGNTSAWDFRLP